MRSKIGNLLMILGAALVLLALLLLNMNRSEDEAAGMAAVEVLPEVIAEIEARNAVFAGTQPEINAQNAVTAAAITGSAVEPTEAADGTMSEMEPENPAEPASTCLPSRYVDPYDTEMTRVTIRGNSYVGYLSIPALGLELPVMAEWSYKRLRTAPCRYTGSTKTDDLVILAHNYARHFGRLSRLSGGDAITFTDMNGVVSRYRVVETETVSPYAVADVTSGEYDLTLFTCTYGGRTRFAVRADKVDDQQ